METKQSIKMPARCSVMEPLEINQNHLEVEVLIIIIYKMDNQN